MNHKYLIYFSFLGFRYHGWQKQPNAKTVQEMVDKTFRCIFGHDEFKTLAAGRTDSKVSALEFVCQLFCADFLSEIELFEKLKINLPPDIDVKSVKIINEKKFRVINDVISKEYIYLLSFSDQKYPFSATLMSNFVGEYDIELMKTGAKLYEGLQDFKDFVYCPKDPSKCKREILSSELKCNDFLTASFFPPESFMFKVVGKGFMRYQVRMMVGTLLNLGMGKISVEDIKCSLKGKSSKLEQEKLIAPSSGLVLNKVSYRE